MLQTEQMAGVWRTSPHEPSEHEFTIDFVRWTAPPPPAGRGIVVARVSMSPLFVTQLIDALKQNGAGTRRRHCRRRCTGEMSQTDPPKITIKHLDDEPLNQDSPVTTSTEETPASDDARETVAAVLAKTLRRYGKLEGRDRCRCRRG